MNDKRLKINNTDLKVSPINFGGNVFGWTLDESKSFQILDKFIDGGFNFIDTADIYSHWVSGSNGGESETIIGNWFSARKNRKDIILATKTGGETSHHPVDTSRAHILKSVDESLKRLQTDYIDLYYTHFDDEKTPIEETLAAYDEIIKAGKVRYIAASNVSPARLIESMEAAEKNSLPGYVALQPHYNLIVRDKFENEYAPLVNKFNLSVFTYWSLEAGFLTGKYRKDEDFEATVRGGGIKQHFTDRGKAVLKALDEVSAKHGSTPAAVSLAWLVGNPLVTAPIVSATSESQLNTIFSSVELKLDAEDVDKLTAAGDA